MSRTIELLKTADDDNRWEEFVVRHFGGLILHEVTPQPVNNQSGRFAEFDPFDPDFRASTIAPILGFSALQRQNPIIYKK